MSPRTSRALALALSGSACAATASDWHHRATPGHGEELAVSDVVADGAGYALIGGDGRQREWWLRVGADGAVSARATGRTAYPALRASGDGRVAGVGDGVLGAGEEAGRACMPSLYASDGTLRWTAAPAAGIACPTLFTLSAQRDGEQAFWVVNPPLGASRGDDYRILADGQVRPLQPPTGAFDWYEYAPTPTAAAAYALYADANGSGLARVLPQRIEWQRQAAADTLLHEVQATADGDALTGGFAAGDAGGQLVLARHAPGGTLRWQRSTDLGGDVMSLRVLAGDRFVVGTRAVGDPASNRIAAFAGNGSELWRVPLGSVRFGGFLRPPSSDPRSAPPVVSFFAGAGEALDRIVGLSAGGQQIYTRPTLGPRGSALLADGSLVNLEQAGQAVELKRWGANGSALPVPDLRSAVPDQYRWRGGIVADDGASVVAEQRLHDRRPRLSEIAPDGAVRWTMLLPPTVAESTLREWPVFADAALACIGPLRYFAASAEGPASPARDIVQCVRRADGRSAFAATLADADRTNGVSTLASIRADGQIELLEASGTALVRTRIAADGRSSQQATLAEIARTPIAAAASAMRSLFVVPTPGGADLVAVDAGGVRVRALALAAVQAVPAVRVLADGGALLHVEHADRAQLYRYDANGALRWQHALEVSTREHAAVPGRVFVDSGGEHVLVAEQPLNPAADTRTAVLDAATGAVRWRDAQRRQSGMGIVAAVLDASRGLALIAHERAGATVLVAHAAADGDAVAVQAVDCIDAMECRARAVHVVADGVRLQADRYDALHGAQVQVSHAALRMPSQSATVAQAGIDGTWYARDSAGQGLVLEYAPAQRALLGGWFTYAPDGAHAAADQRWYSLQGDVAPTAQVAELTIFAGSGGAFAAAGGAQQSIGTATLRLLDCDTAVLAYRFGGAAALPDGELPLVRLTPPPFACTDANGTRPAPSEPSRAAGIEAGQWGTWFDPAAPGQGLSFDLRPPTANGPGLLIGGWFTYDVAGSADDPRQQHWFTLQGDFADARDGRVTVPVFRTIGGGFARGATHNTVRVGTATVQFDGCDRATLDYAFDGSDVAGAYAGRSGRMALVKLAGCAR